ncbi:hypothetical protein [Novosphingobium indicum]|nr:hypothetical protein [Novosphingobium indicum]
MLIRKFIVSIVGAVLVAACGNSGEYYEKPPKQVTSALKSAYLPTHVLGGSVKASRVTQPDAETVVTALLAENNSELMRFVTTVVPDGDGSRVSTAILPPEGRNKVRAEKALAENGLAMGLMSAVAKEHVAAAIEGRPFDMMFASPMGKGMIGAMPGMSERIDAANKAASDFAKYQQQADFDEKYGDDWGRSSSDKGDDWGD